MSNVFRPILPGESRLLLVLWTIMLAIYLLSVSLYLAKRLTFARPSEDDREGGLSGIFPVLLIGGSCLGIVIIGLEFLHAPNPYLPWLFWGSLTAAILGVVLPQSTLWNPLASLSLFFAAFLTHASLNVLLRPERWETLGSLAFALLSWDTIAQTLRFLALSLAFLGLLVALKDETRALGAKILALTGLALFPIADLWSLYTAPTPAKGAALFLWTGATFLPLPFVANTLLMASPSLSSSRRLMAWGGLTLVFLLLGVRYGMMVRYTLEDRLANLEYLASMSLERSKQAAGVKEKVPPDVLGKRVFTQRCQTCHSFEKRVVGPPFNETLGKYVGNTQSLEGFIANPKKIRPDYPPMPRLGLNDEEIKAVASYLMKRYQEEGPKAKGGKG